MSTEAAAFQQQTEIFIRTHLTSESGLGRGIERDEARLRRVLDRAAEYALDLNQYLSHVVGLATDGFLYGNGGAADRLKALLEETRAATFEILPQLTRWEELTSPFADRYDPAEILRAGRTLLDGLRTHMERFGEASLGNLTESAFRTTFAIALAGVSEQVTKRLASLASGVSVEPVTLSGRAQAVVDRIRRDRVEDSLTADARNAAGIRDAVSGRQYGADDLFALWSRQVRNRETLLDLALPAAEADRIRADQEQVEGFLYAFERAVDRTEKKPTAATKIKDARDAIDEFDRKLKKKGLKQEEREDLLRGREAAARSLFMLEATFLDGARSALQAEADRAEEHLSRYRDRLVEARAAVGIDLLDYWQYVRRRLRSNLEPMVAKEVTDRIAGIDPVGQYLHAWRLALEESRLDGSKLQRLAADMADAMDAFAKRVELILKDYLGRPGVELLQDELASQLMALRLEIAQRLRSLLLTEAFR